ncbi:SusC/RagA family TonB-linked outer membrane protein [Chitinophaga sp. SYP-B3965]|uniref:SusC/RagA family TonB-linked outer membrane protein n=1 Tax=Chitinophaga sp. SYP-B3965 TaxID=2663120 RepID=UPI0012996A56|nr:TonB-dependent receptor [Chitinophaga sp. SYP-B3965]MRG45194.1 SusC/RagA family TonB-linked outer membrane protein [Chitinophaga sp. SYP-B3965]
MKKILSLLCIIPCLSPIGAVGGYSSPAPVLPGIVFQSEVIITGTVKDEKGGLLPGVTVRVKNQSIAAVTNESGRYSLKVPNRDVVLVFTFMGYVAQERNVGNGNVLDVTMPESSESLGEVIVVGYGTQKKASVTGAISSVTTKDLLQSPVANISNSLAGRMSGLLARQSSGEPGQDGSTLRIRGVGTFTGSQEPLIMVDGIEVSNYNNIDPNEIESVSILKDASSTAIYGVRGANGVLLITTRRGKEGKPQLNFTTNVALNSFVDLREPMNSSQYTRAYNQAQKYDTYITGATYNPKFSDADIAKYDSGEDPVMYPNTNYYDLLLKKTSLQTQQNLTISGGTEKTKYFISGGLFNQEALFNNAGLDAGWDAQIKFKRYNFRSNFNFDVTKKLKIALDLSLQNENRRGTNASTNRIIQSIGDAPPWQSPGILDGKIVTQGKDQPVSPVAVLLGAGYSKEYRSYLNGTVRADYDLDIITPGLSVHGKISYQNFNSKRDTYGKNVVTYTVTRLPDQSLQFRPNSLEEPFGYSEAIAKNRRTYTEAGIDYNRTFGHHAVTGLILYNQTKLFDPNLAFLVPNGYQGVVGRITYAYKDRYLAEYNAGYNGTENFAEGRRFGFFPAYSVGWIPSMESFFPQNDIVTFLKFRASYGEVGNDRLNNARFLYRPTSYTYSSGYYFGEVGSNFAQYTTPVEGALGNEQLTWERAAKKNLGMEIRLFKGKFSVTADYFSEMRSNILASRQNVSVITGATFPPYNFGKMQNRGVDGDFSFNDHVGNVQYFVRGTFTFATNKILEMDEIPQPYPYQQRTGHRAGQYFGLIAEGLYNSWEEVNDAKRPASLWNNNKIQPGDIRYKDVNGDGIVNEEDYVPIGYSNFPEQLYGLSLGGSYKGFDLSILFQGATKVSTDLPSRAKIAFPLDIGAYNGLLESWSQERYDAGLPISYPHLAIGTDAQQHNYKESNFWIRDASYVRLKNMEIGYTLSANALRRIGISAARFYLNGNNLLTWHNMPPGIDPEAPASINGSEPYPIVKTINFGLNLKF